jgi:hypothetical protein
MFAKINVAAVAVAVTALVIPVVASAHVRTEHALKRHANHLNLSALFGAYGAANGATHSQYAVQAPDGRYLGTDPDPAIRSQLRRDWANGRSN